MQDEYGSDYFERGIETNTSCYSNYRWMPELTIPLAAELIEQLGISRDDDVLDFGCAKGYLVKAFRLLKRKCYGMDVSRYAISQSPHDVAEYIKLIETPADIISETVYDWTIAKDVLEHISYTEIDEVLRNIRNITKKVFVVVPLGGNNKYVVPVYDIDVTHKIRESKDWWDDKFKTAGFDVISSTFALGSVKSNWSQFPDGNGFFILESKCL